MATIDTHNAAHYSWGDHCESWVLASTPGLSVKQELMPPGSKDLLHKHQNSTQVFFILRGTATFQLDAKTIRVSADQSILVPQDTPHAVANETEQPIEFLVISNPDIGFDRIDL